MGDSMANVDARQPGGSNTPRTQYSTSGHRPLPPRVQAARRAQIMISASSGSKMADEMNARLADAVENAPGAPDTYKGVKDRAMGITVGSWCRASDPYAGYLGGRTRLAGPQDMLRHIF